MTVAPFCEERLFFCSLASLALFIATPFMIIFGTFPIRVFGVFCLNLTILFLLIDEGVTFNTVEVLRTVVFNWCVGSVFSNFGCASGCFYHSSLAKCRSRTLVRRWVGNRLT